MIEEFALRFVVFNFHLIQFVLTVSPANLYAWKRVRMNPELDFEKRYRLVREVIETIVLTVLMFLVIRFAVQNFNIEGTSMEPSLHNQELILVDKWTYLFRPPTRGDVIVFVAPPNPDQDYIKRVIGLPGDVITIQNTTVIVDGVTLHERYVASYNQGNLYDYKHISNLVVPPDDYFVLGDNRAGSSDSRDWGFVPKSNIIGRAALVYWPLQQDNNGFLPNVSSVFASVHQGGSALALISDGFMIISSPVLPLAAPIVLLVFLRRRSWARAQRRSPVDAHEPEDESQPYIQDIQAD
jgi:signal peptidase I